MPSFRLARTGDLSAMVPIENNAGYNHWSASQLQHSLEQHTVYVAEANAVLSAFAIFHPVIDEVELLNIVVAPERQGQGIGKALLDYALQQCVQKGLLRCFLEVGATNSKAIALYRHGGFQQTGVRKNYYHRPQGIEDALVMQLELRGMPCRN